MSSLHYSLCSTAGLQAVTDTPDGAAAASWFGIFPRSVRGGAVDWMITGPEGRIHHGRFEAPAGQPASIAVADHVDAVHGQLLRDAARLMSCLR